MTKAYKEGRADKDPADFWYQGEIGFFDFVSFFHLVNYGFNDR